MDEVLVEAVKQLRKIADDLESGLAEPYEISSTLGYFAGVDDTVEVRNRATRAIITWRRGT